MEARHPDGDRRPAPENGGRRVDIVICLVFALMLTVGAAIFPLNVAANKISGLWITLCAAVGIG